jgi:hypothetical protein
VAASFTGREREIESWGWERVVVRHNNGGKVKETIFSVLKVPRQLPLALLAGVKHMIIINKNSMV